MKENGLKLEEKMNLSDFKGILNVFAREAHENKMSEFGEEVAPQIERFIALQSIDKRWKEHLYEMDGMREGIGYQAYAQKDPLIEYQKESYSMFEKMITRVRDQMVEYVFRIELPPRVVRRPKMQETREDASMQSDSHGAEGAKSQKTAVLQKIGRNDPCPCGSGKKYKKCHGKNK